MLPVIALVVSVNVMRTPEWELIIISVLQTSSIGSSGDTLVEAIISTISLGTSIAISIRTGHTNSIDFVSTDTPSINVNLVTRVVTLP